MSWNFLGAVQSHFSQEIISKAASYLGESEDTIKKGISAVIPVSLAGIVKKAEDGNAESLLNFAKQAADSGILSTLKDNFTQGGGGVPSGAPGLISVVYLVINMEVLQTPFLPSLV